MGSEAALRLEGEGKNPKERTPGPESSSRKERKLEKKQGGCGGPSRKNKFQWGGGKGMGGFPLEKEGEKKVKNAAKFHADGPHSNTRKTRRKEINGTHEEEKIRGVTAFWKKMFGNQKGDRKTQRSRSSNS